MNTRRRFLQLVSFLDDNSVRTQVEPAGSKKWKKPHLFAMRGNAAAALVIVDGGYPTFVCLRCSDLGNLVSEENNRTLATDDVERVLSFVKEEIAGPTFPPITDAEKLAEVKAGLARLAEQTPKLAVEFKAATDNFMKGLEAAGKALQAMVKPGTIIGPTRVSYGEQTAEPSGPSRIHEYGQMYCEISEASEGDLSKCDCSVVDPDPASCPVHSGVECVTVEKCPCPNCGHVVPREETTRVGEESGSCPSCFGAGLETGSERGCWHGPVCDECLEYDGQQWELTRVGDQMSVARRSVPRFEFSIVSNPAEDPPVVLIAYSKTKTEQGVLRTVVKRWQINLPAHMAMREADRILSCFVYNLPDPGLHSEVIP